MISQVILLLLVWQPASASRKKIKARGAANNTELSLSDDLSQTQFFGGLYKIRNKRSGNYVCAGSWGTLTNDPKMYQFPEDHRLPGVGTEKGFIWELLDDNTIQNYDNGMFIMAGSYGMDREDKKVLQQREDQKRNGLAGFQWDIKANGLIQNRQSGMYLLPGSHGSDSNDHNLFQWSKDNDDTGFEWEFEAYGPCDEKSIKGQWVKKHYFHLDMGGTLEESYGWSSTKSRTQSKSWQLGFSVEVLRGYSMGPPTSSTGTEVTVGASYSFGASQSYENSKEQTKEEKYTMAPKRSGVVWQWVMSFKDRCGQGDLKSNDFALTNNVLAPPCCPPGAFEDPDKPEGACLSSDLCACSESRCAEIHS